MIIGEFYCEKFFYFTFFDIDLDMNQLTNDFVQYKFNAQFITDAIKNSIRFDYVMHCLGFRNLFSQL